MPVTDLPGLYGLDRLRGDDRARLHPLGMVDALLRSDVGVGAAAAVDRLRDAMTGRSTARDALDAARGVLEGTLVDTTDRGPLARTLGFDWTDADMGVDEWVAFVNEPRTPAFRIGAGRRSVPVVPERPAGLRIRRR